MVLIRNHAQHLQFNNQFQSKQITCCTKTLLALAKTTTKNPNLTISSQSCQIIKFIKKKLFTHNVQHVKPPETRFGICFWTQFSIKHPCCDTKWPPQTTLRANVVETIYVEQCSSNYIVTQSHTTGWYRLFLERLSAQISNNTRPGHCVPDQPTLGCALHTVQDRLDLW